MTRAGAIIVCVTVIAALFGPAIVGIDPAFQDLPQRSARKPGIIHH